ncbi:hypothetical protein KFE25_011205 [Diacronema lutheri]|uniref:Splicing factor YJU2 n=1 Tax=Diacronema lutheri TaxID=2081491 RepID=A0A8J6CD60_DIALT|nr:hypothetical protein KFE25_011205 [Diacronema lutheri]
MGERKVLNKYFGPDFDPEKIPRKKRLKNDQFVVRMMLPMSIRCKECGEYMYKGKKFNSRRENVEGEDYLGIKIIRFYMNCTNCRAEFCIKTDPKNEDYIAEAGAHRNYEPWRDREAAVEAAHAQRAEEDGTDAMKRLENRIKDSKHEMDALDALDELRTMNARNNAASIDELIAQKREPEGEPEARGDAHAAALPQLDDDDEAIVQSIFGQKRMRRMDDSDDDSSLAPAAPASSAPPADGAKAALAAVGTGACASGPPAPASQPPPQPPLARSRPVGGVGTRPTFRVKPKAPATAAAPTSAGGPPQSGAPPLLDVRPEATRASSGSAHADAAAGSRLTASGSLALLGLSAYGGSSSDGGSHSR